MRRINLYILLAAVLLIVLFFSSSTGVQVPVGDTSLGELGKLEPPVSLLRLKRQVETFDDEYPTASIQETEEETGFWDRVVKVALKIFNRFIEWLNS